MIRHRWKRHPLNVASRPMRECSARRPQRAPSGSCPQNAPSITFNRASAFVNFQKNVEYVSPPKETNQRSATSFNRAFLGELLFRQYPALSSRRPGVFCGVVDNVNIIRSPVASYALALAGLFESAVEALAYWYDTELSTPTERRKYRVFGHDFWNSKKMFDTYVEHAGNHSKICKVLEIRQSNAREELCKAGLPALGAVDLKTLGQAILAYADGQSLENACEKNNAASKDANALIRIAISPWANALRAMMFDETASPEPGPAKSLATSDEQILAPSLVA